MPLSTFVDYLNGFDPLAIELLLVPFCLFSIILLYRYLGASGVYVFISIATIAANIQVLKPVQFYFFDSPVALGTVLFSVTFFCTDLLSEFEGKKAALKAVLFGFVSMLIWTVLMILTLGYSPLTPEQAGEDWSWALGVQDNLSAIFLPVPIFFVSSIIAYGVSQLHDIWLYERLKKMTGGRWLWLRNNLSTMISALIDNAVFSLLAWIVFAAEPLAFKVVLQTYILGTYVFRVAVALLDTPFIYLAGKWIGHDKKN